MEAESMVARLQIALWFLFAAIPAAHGQGFTDEAVLSDLTRAGIDRTDPDALVRALSGRYAVQAAFALGKLPSSPQIVGELRQVLKSTDDLLVLFSARSLIALNDGSWTSSVRERMDAFTNPSMQVQMAGVLAQAGDYSGWKHVTSILLDPNTDRWTVSNAFIAASSFFGMKDERGQQLNIPLELVRLTPQMPASHLEQAQTEIQGLFNKLDRKRRGIPEPDTSKGPRY